jgi:alpha-glucosidase
VGRVWPGPSAFPDFTRTEVRQWYGTLYRDQVNMGVRGFWNDMNEPAVFFVPGKSMPIDGVHRTDDGAKHPHAEMHNIVGLENVRATYEGMLKLKPDERPFVMTRAAYAGAQRYASSWTGDNTGSWNHMRISVRGVLNLGISGFPFQGVDIGGYAGTPPADLLTRWFELGAFMPIFRDHTEKGSGDQEPWVHGPEQEAIRRRYIDLRYRLLPYLYTSIEEMSRTGVPLLRPLFFEFPADDSLASTDDEFFFGPDILVSPQLFEMLDNHSVTLPEGEWYDFWTGAKVKAPAAPLPIGGPQVRNPLKVKITLDQLPIYVRPGAIIPMQPLVQSTAEKPQGPLELRVYPGPNCRGSIYHDDGNSFRYQQGEFFRQSFTCTADAGSVTVKLGNVEGSFAPWWETVAVAIIGVEKQPASVTAGGNVVAASQQRFDAQEKTFTVTLLKPAPGSEVVVQY